MPKRQREGETETERQRQRQRERETDRQTDRQRQRQRDRERASLMARPSISRLCASFNYTPLVGMREAAWVKRLEHTALSIEGRT